MKILADAHIPFLKEVIERFGDVTYLPGNRFSREAIRDKEVLIVRTVTRFNEEMLAGTGVKLICSATIGFDHIDTDYCDTHGIAWRTAPGCNAASVEQYVTASLLYMAEKKRFRLQDASIGIVGVGHVGRKVENACRKLGMRVLLNDPPREEREGHALFVDLETIQREADIITFHTPLTRTGAHPTHHLADGSFFAQLKRHPIIINASRGSVVDNKALQKALNEGSVSGAVVDCWEHEPDMDRALLQRVDIATPHIAGYSADGKWMATKMCIEQINAFFHLGMQPRWAELPPPTHPLIDLLAVPAHRQLSYAVWHTYDPATETAALKKSPEDFYFFRSHYPLRREYAAYRVIHAADTVTGMLEKLGFEVIRS